MPKTSAKRTKCKLNNCGGEGQIYPEEGPYFVACKKCGRETASWAYKREAWKEWKIINNN